jgi:hypothetical protein
VARRDVLTADELPPELGERAYKKGWRHRAFKDPVAFREEVYVRPARTPCEAAWKVRAYRDSVLEWLIESGGGGRRALIFVVQMPDRSVRFALFQRELRVVGGVRLVVVRDNLSSSVFAGRPSYVGEPMPACRRRPARRKARNVRRKAFKPIKPRRKA